MVLSLRKNILVPFLTLLVLLLLAGCGGSSTPQAQTKLTPSPTPIGGQGQQLLTAMANKLNNAKTLHGIFNLAITGQNFNGTVNTEVWNEPPAKNRALALQSSLPQIEVGSVTVTDGKQIWQYDPAKKVVYNGPVTANANGTTNAGRGVGSGVDGGQSQFLLNLVQTVFTRSDATLISSSATANGHSVYELHIVPQGGAKNSSTGSFDYAGEVYIDKTSLLPVKVDLNIQGIGKVVLDLPTLELNKAFPDNTFVFVVPAGVKVLPLQQASATAGTGTLSLAQAQQQAGYHLLSIPGDQTDYVLQGVNALGAPGNQIYTLNYMRGNLSFSIAEGKPLANLPGAAGQQVSVRGTSGTLSSSNGVATLAWTEKGVGIQITGNLSNNQLQEIAKLLS